MLRLNVLLSSAVSMLAIIWDSYVPLRSGRRAHCPELLPRRAAGTLAVCMLVSAPSESVISRVATRVGVEDVLVHAVLGAARTRVGVENVLVLAVLGVDLKTRVGVEDVLVRAVLGVDLTGGRDGSSGGDL